AKRRATTRENVVLDRVEGVAVAPLVGKPRDRIAATHDVALAARVEIDDDEIRVAAECEDAIAAELDGEATRKRPRVSLGAARKIEDMDLERVRSRLTEED